MSLSHTIGFGTIDPLRRQAVQHPVAALKGQGSHPDALRVLGDQVSAKLVVAGDRLTAQHAPAGSSGGGMQVGKGEGSAVFAAWPAQLRMPACPCRDQLTEGSCQGRRSRVRRQTACRGRWPGRPQTLQAGALGVLRLGGAASGGVMGRQGGVLNSRTLKRCAGQS